MYPHLIYGVINNSASIFLMQLYHNPTYQERDLNTKFLLELFIDNLKEA